MSECALFMRNHIQSCPVGQICIVPALQLLTSFNHTRDASGRPNKQRRRGNVNFAGQQEQRQTPTQLILHQSWISFGRDYHNAAPFRWSSLLLSDDDDHHYDDIIVVVWREPEVKTNELHSH